jgi:hypothetical protein
MELAVSPSVCPPGSGFTHCAFAASYSSCLIVLEVALLTCGDSSLQPTASTWGLLIEVPGASAQSWPPPALIPVIWPQGSTILLSVGTQHCSLSVMARCDRFFRRHLQMI